MSYAYMDHAGWVRKNIDYEMSELGKTVANIVGYSGGGIYNCPVNVDKTDWSDPWYIKVMFGKYLTNWDFCDLSKLWVLCHRKMVRIEINPCSPTHLKIEFWQRKKREGGTSERLPDCEEMIALVDSEFPDGYGHL
jgi:hypothetical protein